MSGFSVIDTKTNQIEEKPYNLCLECEDLGVCCDGPNFLAMTLERWCEWCRLRKENLGWTNAYIAEISGVSQVTVDRIMAGKCSKDIRRSTCADISSALVGSLGKYPCARPAPTEMVVDNPEHLQKIEEKEQEIVQLRTSLAWLREELKNTTEHMEQQAHDRETYLKELVAKQDERLAVRESQIAAERARLLRVIKWLAISLGIVVGLVIAILIYDKMNPNVGWFRDMSAYISY